MSYYVRIGLVTLALALLTGLLIWRGPHTGALMIVAATPDGDAVPGGAAVSMTFSRPVDRPSVESRFTLDPPVAGRFYWADQTLTFVPDRPLDPATSYAVQIAAGIQDSRGRANPEPLGWSFRTRGAQLLVVTAESAGGSALWLLDPASGTAEQVVSTEQAITAVTAAPNGQAAVYATPAAAGRSRLVLADLAGGGTRPLVDQPEVAAGSPAWAPVYDQIAFEQRTDAGLPRIALVSPDGASFGPLWGDPTVGGRAPVWAPDGNRLAFVDAGSGGLMVYNFFSDARLPISAGTAASPSWAPDGMTLVYAGQDGDSAQIRRAELGVTGEQVLVDGAAHSPAWAPDGAWIAFVRDDGAGSAVWLMRPDGSDQRALTQPGPFADSQPAWSPASRQLAFMRRTPGRNEPGAVWVVDVAGGAARPLREEVTHMVWVP